jgi:hypothetical protein
MGWSNGPMPACAGEVDSGPGGEEVRSVPSRLLVLALLVLLLLAVACGPKALLFCMRS